MGRGKASKTRTTIKGGAKIIEKLCLGCGEFKKLNDFHTDSKGLMGKRSRCRDCTLTVNKMWKKENRERTAEINRLWYYENKDKDEFKEKKKDYDHNWYLRNKERVRIKNRRRRARLKELPDNLTIDDQNEIIKFFGGCSLTGDKDGIHMDHVIPLSIGHGGTVRGNIIPLREDLNESKGDRNIFEWFEENKERFGLSQEKFNNLIDYLANINEMTTEEYRDYVYWCHDNPRYSNMLGKRLVNDYDDDKTSGNEEGAI